MKQGKEKIKYWLQIFLLPIFWFSFLVPRNKKIWVFGSTFGRRFADNPRYFYLFLAQNTEEIRPIWISHNREIVDVLNKHGYEAFYHYSLKGIWYCLRSKVYLYDNYPKDINQWLSGGAVKINLWHGIPLKKIQMDNIYDQVRHPQNIRKKIYYLLRRFTDEKPSHYIVSTSEFFKPIFSSAFATSKVLVTGYPRTDVYTGKTINNIFFPCEDDSLHKIASMKQGRKIFLYMPTFRDSETLFFETMKLEMFNQFLKKNDYLFCVKLHCKSKLKKIFEEIESNHIIVIDANADPNVFIEISDALITDYSSIYFDYLLTDKPIIFFHYDLDEYISQSREMYFDYEEYTPGEKASNGDELEEVMLRLDELQEHVSKDNKRKQIKEVAFGNHCFHSSERLKNEIIKELKK